MVNYLYLIIVFPFIAFCANIFFGRRLKSGSAYVSIAASALAFLFSIFAFLNHSVTSVSFGTWLTINGRPLNFGILLDPLTVMMLLIVTFIGTLIQIYSIGYMANDPRYSRYFAYMSLFMSCMLGLVMADNLLMMYIFWEGVGLCSYLLISFWFERPSAAKAGLKAFITTRIGDTGLLLGIFILFFTTGTIHFLDLEHLTGNEFLLTVVALLIFSGAVGKSAQFPLHVWLPDAMEGPTAVSALIHAATMVVAGVYLVARTYVLFVSHPIALLTVAIIGGISALLAAFIALVNNDIKRILAYSTISQLGLMMLALGVGGFTAGTFHLMTHAFFKALLFLCAGSIIHGVHTQDIRKMGGLLGQMPLTGWTFLIGSLAIAGVAPLSGFWSKDEILTAALKSGNTFFFGVVLLTSLLTAFYMFRLIFLVLFGKPRSDMHAHESPISMTIPLVILSAFAVCVGLSGSPFFHHAFQNFVYFKSLPGEEHPQYFVMVLSSAVSLLGIGLAYVLYIQGNKILSLSIRSRFQGLYQLLLNKFYFDEIYQLIFVQPTIRLCAIMSAFDLRIIDGIVNGSAKFVRWTSDLLRPIQTGLIQNYLLVAVVGVIVFVFLSLRGGL